MEKLRNKTYKIQELEKGDRFYFYGSKSKPVHEVIRHNIRTGQKLSVEIENVLTKVQRRKAYDVAVVFLRNVNEKN